MSKQFPDYKKDVQTALESISTEKVRQATELFRRIKSQNATAWIVGNGGSAATASHFANDLLKMAGVRAVALNDMGPTMTAFGNDDGWENMFAHPLAKLMLPQDALVAISCSGFSANIVTAMEFAKGVKMPGVKTLVLTGETWDSPLTALKPDVAIHVPFSDIRVQEDCHLVICHAIAGGI